jgi:ferredoxin-NADP reductase
MSRRATMRARVARVENLNAGLRHVVLEPEEAGLFPAASAGAHIVLELRHEGRVWRNPYSLISAPGAREEYRIIVRRAAASRGGSAYIHEHLRAGEVFPIEGPRNMFWPATTARKHLMLAGGIGITPFLSYLPALAGQNAELHVRCKAEDEAAFARLLAAWPNAHLHPSGKTAFSAGAILAAQPLGTHLYLCGPDAFMAAIEEEAAALGWISGKIHREYFGGNSTGQAFSVVLARDGRTLAVAPDQSLLEALEQAGVDAPSLCRGGACGACKITVLEGVPDHRDHFLSGAERAGGRAIMACVSRAHSGRLVLDM